MLLNDRHISKTKSQVNLLLPVDGAGSRCGFRAIAFNLLKDIATKTEEELKILLNNNDDGGVSNIKYSILSQIIAKNQQVFGHDVHEFLQKSDNFTIYQGADSGYASKLQALCTKDNIDIAAKVLTEWWQELEAKENQEHASSLAEMLQPRIESSLEQLLLEPKDTENSHVFRELSNIIANYNEPISQLKAFCQFYTSHEVNCANLHYVKENDRYLTEDEIKSMQDSKFVVDQFNVIASEINKFLNSAAMSTDDLQKLSTHLTLPKMHIIHGEAALSSYLKANMAAKDSARLSEEGAQPVDYIYLSEPKGNEEGAIGHFQNVLPVSDAVILAEQPICSQAEIAASDNATYWVTKPKSSQEKQAIVRQTYEGLYPLGENLQHEIYKDFEKFTAMVWRIEDILEQQIDERKQRLEEQEKALDELLVKEVGVELTENLKIYQDLISKEHQEHKNEDQDPDMRQCLEALNINHSITRILEDDTIEQAAKDKKITELFSKFQR